VGLVNHEAFINCPHQSTLQVWEFATSISKPKWVGLKENLLETTNLPGKCDDVWQKTLFKPTAWETRKFVFVLAGGKPRV